MIKDGDIYRWRYKDEKPSDRGDYKRYHCMSQFAVARLGFLADTFWSTGSSSVFWPYAEAEQKLALELLGNLNDLENRPEYETMHYDSADCVDINHSNSSKGNFYVRKGAVRSRDRMRAVVTADIITLEREVSFAQGRLIRARENLDALERGDDLNSIHI